jgi:hypothetical protein
MKIKRPPAESRGGEGRGRERQNTRRVEDLKSKRLKE